MSSRARTSSAAGSRSLSSSPGLKQRQRVHRLAALLVPAAHPDLEVEVRSERAAAAADLADLLARRHALALDDGNRAAAQVHEDVVALVVGVEHHVVAGAGALVAHPG